MEILLIGVCVCDVCVVCVMCVVCVCMCGVIAINRYPTHFRIRVVGIVSLR